MTATELAEEAARIAEAQPPIDVQEVAADEEPTGQAVERVHGAPQATAIEAAANAALTMPGVPGRDEFLALAMQARILCLSGAAPRAVRNNPHLAFHMAMVGRDLNISPSASLELIDVIEGKFDQATGEKQLRLSLSPQLLNGQIRRLGLGSIRPRISTPTECVAVALGPDGEELGESTFTWEDARMAGLVGEGCEPGEHKMKDRKGRNNTTYQACGCNQGYITYPKRMLWWRAGGFAADDFFPEASLGMYAPEALGAVVDEDGRPIDPATIELPEGYTEQVAAPKAKDKPPSEKEAVCSQEEQAAIKARIAVLPPPAVAALTERWTKQDPGTGSPTLWPLKRLPNRQVKAAHALIDSVEKQAREGAWGEWVGATTTDAPDQGPGDAVSAPEPPSGTEGPPDQPAATQGADPDGMNGDDDTFDGYCEEPGCTDLVEEPGSYCIAHEPF